METRCGDRQKPESWEAISCIGKITISQYINRNMHAVAEYGAMILTNHSSHTLSFAIH